MRSILLIAFTTCMSYMSGNLTASSISLEEWVNQPIDTTEIQLTIGDGPSDNINWREPAIIVFGTFDRLEGLHTNDLWRFQRHGRTPKADYLSNYFMTQIVVEGLPYKSVEHYYQAIKFPINSPIYNEIIQASTADEARRIATQNASSASLGNDNEMANRMKYALWAKFVDQDGSPTYLGLQLLDTGEQPLIEGNKRFKNSDKRWGAEIDFSQMPQRAILTGKNLLGKLLMDLRDILHD